jgi:hypothetical protein
MNDSTLPFLALAAALICAGCTLTLPGSGDAGATEEAGTTVTETVGEQCTEILTELCNQSINRCGLQTFTVQDCVSNDMSQCCVTTCGNKSTQSETAVDTCKTDIDDEDCNAIVNSTTPSDCSTLVGLQ